VTEQRMLEEIAVAQDRAELEAVMPHWCAWFEGQPDGPALDPSMDRIHDAWDARLDAFKNAEP
jgi:hypothetical protein